MDNESDGSHYGYGRFKIHGKRRKYMYSVYDEETGWSEWETTTTVMIKKLHVGAPGWPKLWPEWEEAMLSGEIVESAVDGIRRRFTKNG